jgi:hypothetical protein
MLFNPPYQFHWRAAPDGCGGWPSLDSPLGPDIRIGQYMYTMDVGATGAGTCSRLTGFGVDLGSPRRDDGSAIAGGSATLLVSANIIPDSFFSVNATLSGASNRSWMKVYLEEFNPAGNFLGTQASSPQNLFIEQNGFYFDFHLRRVITSPFILNGLFSVRAGNNYRLWVDLEGLVQATGRSTVGFIMIGSRVTAAATAIVQSISASFV